MNMSPRLAMALKKVRNDKICARRNRELHKLFFVNQSLELLSYDLDLHALDLTSHGPFDRGDRGERLLGALVHHGTHFAFLDTPTRVNSTRVTSHPETDF